MEHIEIFQNEEGKSQLALKIMGDSRFSPGAVSDRFLKKAVRPFFVAKQIILSANYDPYIAKSCIYCMFIPKPPQNAGFSV